MAKINDGGPAFPRPMGNEGDEQVGSYNLAQEGMSLRDWFAGMALTGLCSRMDEELINQIAQGVRGGRAYVETAYKLANAMISVEDSNA